MNLITQNDIPESDFREYRKSALTRARELTQVDFEQMGGTVQTLEGPASFQPGDFLAVGVQDEQWPISKATMAKTKQQVSEQDDQGWADYAATNTVRAVQMSEPFRVQISTGDILTGKAGGYFVVSGSRAWIVDEEIFAQTYEEVTM